MESSEGIGRECRPVQEEDRSTKKARFKEGGGEGETHIFSSFRDKVVEGKRIKESELSGELDTLEIREEDVHISIQNNVPSIQFSDKVHEGLLQPWKHTVVVKLMRRKIGYSTLRMRLETMWRMLNNFIIIDLENDYFLVKFKCEEDMQYAMTEGPWVFLGNYLTVQRWTPAFNCYCNEIQSLVVWIRLPGMPVHYYNKKVLRLIGQIVSRVVRIDYNTDSVTRGKFARLAVEVQVAKPLVSQFHLDGRLQLVEYECIPTICFTCGCIGHNALSCPNRPPSNNNGDGEGQNRESEGCSKDQGERLGGNTAGASRRYGEWMVVQKRGRPRTKQGNQKENNGERTIGKQGGSGSRSRFDILGEDLREENQEKGKGVDTEVIGNSSGVYSESTRIRQEKLKATVRGAGDNINNMAQKEKGNVSHKKQESRGNEQRKGSVDKRAHSGKGTRTRGRRYGCYWHKAYCNGDTHYFRS